MNYYPKKAFTVVSTNKKTGKMFVGKTDSSTCWNGCGMFKACYGKYGPISWKWNDLNRMQRRYAKKSWSVFLTALGNLKSGEKWRDQEVGDLIPDTAFLRPDQASADQDRFNQIHDLMEERLTPRERDILKMRFGFGVRDLNTLEKIGKKYNVTRERIRQIEMKAFRKLRFVLEKRKKELAQFDDYR